MSRKRNSGLSQKNKKKIAVDASLEEKIVIKEQNAKAKVEMEYQREMYV